MTKENLYKQYTPPASGGGAYLKFEDAKLVRLRIMSEPVVFDSTFQKGEEINVSTKYCWVIWNLDEKCAQVMTLPGTAYKLVAAYGADEDWGDPVENAYDLKITRRGTGLETEYSIVASAAKTPLGDDEQNEAKGLDLIAMTEASPSASKVQWLRDVIEHGRTKADTSAKADVFADVDEPINLDDIPY